MDPRDMTLYRGGCTDPNFNDPACGKCCLEVQNDIDAVWACGNGRKYACQSLSNCNSSSYTPFSLDAATLLPNSAASTVFNLTTSSTPTISTSSSSSTNSASALACASSTSVTPCPSSIGTYAGIGAGLGVPLLITLGLSGFLFYKNRKLRKVRSNPPNMVSETPASASSPGYQQRKSYEDKFIGASPTPVHNASRYELGSDTTM